MGRNVASDHFFFFGSTGDSKIAALAVEGISCLFENHKCRCDEAGPDNEVLCPPTESATNFFRKCAAQDLMEAIESGCVEPFLLQRQAAEQEA